MSQMQRHWKAACVLVGCWTFLALLFTPQTYIASLRSPAPPTWGQAFVASLTLFYIWAALTPLVLWLGRRFPFERHSWRNLVIHLLLCGPVALLHIGLLQLVNALLRNQPPAPLWALLVGLGATNIMVYWAIVAASHAINYFRKYRERGVRGGVGLINTRERLKHLYNDAHTFDLSSSRGKGVTVRISVPFKEISNDRNVNY